MEPVPGLVVRYILSVSNSGKLTTIPAIIFSVNEEDYSVNLQLSNQGGNVLIATSVGIDWIIPEYDT